MRPRAVAELLHDHVSNMTGAQLLRLGWKAQERSIFPSANSSIGLTEGSALITQWMSLTGSSPT